MQDGFSDVFTFSMRQISRVEVIAAALLQALTSAVTVGVAWAVLTYQVSLVGRPELDVTLASLPFSFLAGMAMIALFSRLNGRLFGRPFPAGVLGSAWRYFKAIFALMLLILALTVPIGVIVVVAWKLVLDSVPEGVLAVLPAAFGFVLAYVVFIRYMLLPIMVIYEGRVSLGRAKALIAGRRGRAFGVVLAIGLISFAANLLTLAVAGTFMPPEFAVLFAGPVGALAYGPMTVAVSVFYFTGVERLNAPASESGLIESPGPAVTA
ncbi:hypothetical protein D3874_23515 [Oleomonas cavernae]|uniref:Uncharacterized protein n=1 Tax=Oleomonas cavernae TaxID=2320859 RepID=A0A418WHU7_9PROT|nr:hypothetical protein [Oleomonas cavernae]RJF89568.1 hypothetical protein D3874_23515 [Oleomonas cavernae]